MSITLNGSTYDVTYSSGVATDFEEQPGATLNVDPWGMDAITRRFAGRLDKVTTELAKYKRSRVVKDLIYPDLVAVSWSVQHDSPFPVLTVNYAGIIGGQVPDPVFKSGYRAQSVQLTYSGLALIATSESVSVRYKAPYTQAKYILKDKPKAAKYKNAVELTADALEITRISGDGSREMNFLSGGSLLGAISSTPPGGKANAYNGIVEIVTTQLEFEKVGAWYEVTETNEMQILPLALGGNSRVVIK